MGIGSRGWPAFSQAFGACLLPIFVVAAPAGAQQARMPTHLGHVASGFPGAPDGRGLAVTTAAEVSLAMRHANLAAGDLSDLASMQTHAGHVLHLLSPEQGGQGPGLGFGVIPGVQAIRRHVELAAGADGASASLRTHAGHVALAASAVEARAGEIADIARTIQSAETASQAAPLAEQLRQRALQLDTGEDVNGSGRLDLDGVEGGFEQLEDHTYLILEGERLPRTLR